MSTTKKKQNKNRQGRSSVIQQAPGTSIRQAEERPDLNTYLTGKAVNLKAEQPVLKPTLAEHLANPYIYIKKVLNKHRNNYFTSEHPEDWDRSCNVTSLRRPKTRGGHPQDQEEGVEREKSQSPSPDRDQSPQRLNSQVERKEKYEENANLRSFVYDFFEQIYQNLTQREQRRGYDREGEIGSAQSRNNDESEDVEDLKERFERFAKQKKLVFPKGETDKAVSDKVFAEFLRNVMGVPPKDQEKVNRRLYEEPQEPTIEEKQFNALDIEKFFRAFAENKGNATKKDFKISMKAFLFNYKKYVTSKYRIRDILSEKASKTRNNDVKIYIRDFLASYDMIRNYLAQLKEKERNIASSLVAYDLAGRPEGGVALLEIFNQLTDHKDHLVFERKVLVRFLELRNKRFPESLIDLNSLNDLIHKVFREEKSGDLTLLGNFIHDFKREKQLFKEDHFTTFEVVNFIQEKKYTRAQFEVISYFIAQLRKAYNRNNNLIKDEYVDPRTPIPNGLLSSTFERLCKKAENQNLVLDKLVENLGEEFEKHRGTEATMRTNKIIEHNVLADFIYKKFLSIDKNLLADLDKIEELSNYLSREEIDRIPMEEIRERSHFILTGNELRERSRNAKKLEGFTRMLKGQDASPIRQGYPEETVLQSRNKQELYHDPRLQDKDQRDIHYDDPRLQTRNLHNFKEDPRLQDKNKYNQYIDPKLEKDLDYHYDDPRAQGKNNQYDARLQKDYHYDDPRLQGKDRPNFKEEDPRLQDRNQKDYHYDPRTQGKNNQYDPRLEKDIHRDDPRLYDKNKKDYHYDDPRLQGKGRSNFKEEDPRSQGKYSQYDPRLQKDTHHDDPRTQERNRQDLQYEDPKLQKILPKDEPRPELRQRFERDGTEIRVPKFIESDDDYVKLLNGERIEREKEREQERERRREQEEKDNWDWKGAIDPKYNKPVNDIKESVVEDETDDLIFQLNARPLQARKEEQFKNVRNEDIESYIRGKPHLETESKVIPRDYREPDYRRNEPESYAKIRQHDYDPRYEKDPRAAEADRYLKGYQERGYTGKDPQKDPQMNVDEYLKMRNQKDFDARYAKDAKDMEVENYLRAYQQRSPETKEVQKDPRESQIDEYLKARNQKDFDARYTKDAKEMDVENYLKARQYGAKGVQDYRESMDPRDPRNAEIENYLRGYQQRVPETKTGQKDPRDVDIENYLRARESGAKGVQDYKNVVDPKDPRNTDENYLKMKLLQQGIQDREKILNAGLDARTRDPLGRDKETDKYISILSGDKHLRDPRSPEQQHQSDGYQKNLSDIFGTTAHPSDKPYETRDFREFPSFRGTFLETLKSQQGEGYKSSALTHSPEKQQVLNALLEKNEKLCKQLDDCKDPNFLTKSTLKGRTDDAVVVPETVNLGKDKPKMGRFSDYEMLMPSDYYSFLAKKNVEMDKDPWYIRSHHIETLTEHPKSVKDNLLGAEYVSYYSALPKDEKMLAKEKEIVGYSDKEGLLKSLEENRNRLKQELDSKLLERNKRKELLGTSGFKDSKGLKEVSKYYDTREVTEGPGLMIKAYEGILDDLRSQEKNILNQKRGEELSKLKPPPNKWWELKDKTFIDEYIKHVFMTNSDPMNVQDYLRHVEELQIEELI